MNAQLAQGLGEMIVMLVLMVLAIVAMAWLARRTRAFGLQGSQTLRIVQTLPLGTRERAVLVELQGQKILLGVTAQQINTLWQALPVVADNLPSLTDKLSVGLDDDKIRLELPASPPAKGFSAYLNKLLVRESAC